MGSGKRKYYDSSLHKITRKTNLYFESKIKPHLIHYNSHPSSSQFAWYVFLFLRYLPSAQINQLAGIWRIYTRTYRQLNTTALILINIKSLLTGVLIFSSSASASSEALLHEGDGKTHLQNIPRAYRVSASGP